MAFKTIISGLGIFRIGSEKSIHGRPSLELAPYDLELELTNNFSKWTKHTYTGQNSAFTPAVFQRKHAGIACLKTIHRAPQNNFIEPLKIIS